MGSLALGTGGTFGGVVDGGGGICVVVEDQVGPLGRFPV